MARFFGKVGYIKFVESEPYVHKEEEIIREYYGDVISASRRMQSTDRLNDDVQTSTRISIMADAYALLNFMDIRFVEWNGVLWKVQTAEPARPRITLYLGGVYNGDSHTTGGPAEERPGE